MQRFSGLFETHTQSLVIFFPPGFVTLNLTVESLQTLHLSQLKEHINLTPSNLQRFSGLFETHTQSRIILLFSDLTTLNLIALSLQEESGVGAGIGSGAGIGRRVGAGVGRGEGGISLVGRGVGGVSLVGCGVGGVSLVGCGVGGVG